MFFSAVTGYNPNVVLLNDMFRRQLALIERHHRTIMEQAHTPQSTTTAEDYPGERRDTTDLDSNFERHSTSTTSTTARRSTMAHGHYEYTSFEETLRYIEQHRPKPLSFAEAQLRVQMESM